MTIRGKLFGETAADNTVTFLGAEGGADDVEAMVSTSPAATTTELTVTVPPAAQTGPISVMVGTAADTSLQDFAVLIGEDKDENDNGLIEVSSLEQLDAMRYDLDGNGAPSGTTAEQAAYRTAFELSGAGAAAGCTGGCVGYELMSNLDFDNLRGAPSIWSEDCTDGTCQTAAAVDGDNADKVGWKPIGYYNSSTDKASYTATFEGNDYMISNLYINRPSTSYVGLFGFLGLGNNVRNLGIEGGSLTGNRFVGGLVGYSEGTIIACYATGDATGTGDLVGGLVGGSAGTISACYATGNASGDDRVGGLVGENSGTISACYATGNATGTSSAVGGLVGNNSSSGTISACYATGDATGTGDFVGGLVGYSEGTISACYATGNATGTGSDVGGLVGDNFTGTVTNSYFDSNVSNRTDSDDHAKTTTDLQTPTAYDDNADATDGSSIYETWNIDVDNGQPIGVDDGTAAGDATADDPWEFGTDMQYPALRVDFDRSGTASVVEFGTQPRTAFRVSSFTPERGIVGATVTIRGKLFGETAADNTVTFLGAAADGADDVEATVSAATATSLVVTVPDGAMTGRIQVAVSGEMASSTTDFRVLILSPYTDADGLIDVTTLAQLDAIRYDLDGDGRPTSAGQIAWQTAFLAAATVDDDAAVPDVSTGFTGYELRSDLDFNNVGGSPSIWSENCADGACQTATAVDGDNADKVGWAPLGDFSNAYTATFDGRGHTISNLYINRPSTSDVGLFGFLGTGGNVRNLGIEGGSLSGSANVGGLVGRNRGTITACYATGDANGAFYVGGLVGENSGSGTIRACYATGDVTGTGSNVGGLVGRNSGGTISACYATGNVTGSAENVGGLVGRNAGTIRACYATGNATGTGVTVGGLVGNNGGPISACYATGNASGDDHVGGLVGANFGGTISACYATGNATATGSDVGGLVGDNLGGTVTNSYFDSTVSNRTDSDDYSKTTTELQTPTAYGTAMEIYANWNIDVDNGADAGIDDGTMPGDAAADDPWDFGTDSQYPVLKVDFNVSGSPTAFEFGGQGRVSTTVPDALAALTATAANAEVTLSWTAAASDGAPITGYMIDYSVSADFSSPPTTRTTAAAATSYTVSGLTNGTLYYFRVAAVNAAGTAAYYPGAANAAVSATPAAIPFPPSALTATAADAEVTLSWDAPASDRGAAITGYMIEHSLMVDFSSPTTATTAAAATSHTVSGLTNGTLYYFRVAAVNSVGTSAYYPGASGTAVSATPAAIPDAPSALTAMAANAEVTLSWTAAASDGGATITGYIVEYDTDMNFLSPTPETTAAAATSHTVTGLTNGTPYYFRVAAVNAAGTSAYYPGATDAAVSATPATVPSPPSALTAMAADAAVTLNWTAPSGNGGAAITGYMIEHDTDMNFSSTPVTTAAAATSHTVSGLTNATPYYFRVAAVNAAGTGAYYPGATDAAVTATPVAAPVVSSFTPEMGAVGEAVMITGTGFSTTATENTVVFLGAEGDADNAAATVSAATAASLTVSVPSTAQTGKISVMVGTAADTSAASFTVTGTTPAPAAPVVSSFSPTEGEVDTEVTITGVNFSATPSANDLRFGGVMAAAPTSASTTSLVVLVPSGAVTGRISVAVGGQTGTSSTDFTVTGTTPAPDPPVVLSFSPSEGEVDTEVTITGVNFSATASANEVRFGGVMAADPTSASTTSLVVLVPNGAVTGRVSVAVGGQTGTSSENFTVTAPAPAPAAPVVSSFSPTEGEVDTEVTITGVNFSDMSSENEVRFGGVMAAAPTSASTTSLVVLVPSGARTGSISVAVGGQTGTSSENFTVTAPAPAPAAPVVSSFSPTEGVVDTEVTITGVNFSATPSENDLRFGGMMAADPTSASTTSLVVLVPSGARTGSISVAVGGQTGTSSESFTVTGTVPAPEPPVVSSFSPLEGEVGTSVTITGDNFSATPSENDLRFGGVMAADPTSASTTSLTVLVPSGARTGSISVAVGGQTGTSSENFTVTAPAPAPEPPVVSSFSPLEGEVGTSVTITGENFSETPSENEVRFGGVMAAAPTSASATSLTILVPSGARTGSISVAVGGQTGTSSTDFTVTAPTPEPAAFSVPLSSEGDVRLYPNPTSGQLHFKGLLAGGRYVCDLYSLVGQKVLSSVVRAGDTMDTSTLSSGQYILILQAEGRELMRTRLLVVR